jgi:transketolase
VSFVEKFTEFESTLSGGIPKDLSQILLKEYEPGVDPTATRTASGDVMNIISSIMPSFLGGSADLAPSTKTTLTHKEDITKENPGGNNIHFGVREHAMGAVANGMALHGGVIPYTATFLTFYDYMRPAVRLGALMGLHVIYIFSHDSIGLGEDGPTHQPIEHIVGMRAVPNLTVIRPADSLETMQAWDYAINESGRPTALILSRQNLPQIQRDSQVQENNISKGAYIVHQSELDIDPDVILIATGSEVHVAVESAIELRDNGINIRVVSMPSWEIFDAQEIRYRDLILPPNIKKRISVEAGSTLGWSKYVGLDGVSIGIDEFGASAPGNKILFEFGFHSKYIISKIMEIFKD